MARRSGRKTDYEWASVCGLATDFDVGIGTTALGNGSFNINAASTITRIHGLFAVQLDATAADERAVVAFGVIKVTDEALAAGAGAIPSPDTDGDAPWIVHGYLWVSSLAEAAVQPQALYDRVRIDSKAMRKAKASDSLAVMFEVCDLLD